jgi:hypothetical protein
MNKKFLIPMFAVLVLGSVLAVGYLVSSFVIQSDVYEPFSVEYAILGDGGNYDGELCSSLTDGDWLTLPSDSVVDVQGLYAGESRKFCVRITNAGEGDVDYTISSKVKTGFGNYDDCVMAFPETTKTGTTLGLSQSIDGEVIEVPDNAPVVEDCLVEISVSRG